MVKDIAIHFRQLVGYSIVIERQTKQGPFRRGIIVLSSSKVRNWGEAMHLNAKYCQRGEITHQPTNFYVKSEGRHMKSLFVIDGPQ